MEGPSIPLHAALCLRPGGTHIEEEVAAAVLDAGRRLADAGCEVEELEDTPSLHEADEVTFDLWFGDGFAGQADAAKHDGDPGALAVIAGVRAKAEGLPVNVVARSLVRRTTLMREWLLFLEVSGVVAPGFDSIAVS